MQDHNSHNQPDYSLQCNSAWHAHKYIDPAESGAVLPILHANGFKIAERTLFGTMDDKEIISLFTSVAHPTWASYPDHARRGYGYQVCIVEDLPNLDNELFAALQWAIQEIRKIQGAARLGQPLVKPRWPVIILRTPKVKLLPVAVRLADTST